MSIIDLFPLLVRLSLLKYFSLGNTCVSSISHWMFGFQAKSTSFTWKSFMQLSHSTKPNSQKKLSTYVQFSKSIKHWVIKQSGTHVRKIRMEQHWTFKFQTLDDMCVNYWSSVKVVKVMKGLASFNISISELILKYIFSVKMSVHLFTKEKVFKSASWNHLDFTLCSLIGLNSKHFPSESSACQISLAFLLSQGWLSFYIWFFFSI